MNTSQKDKIQVCILVNAFAVIFIAMLVSIVSSGGSYFDFGWNDHLTILDVPINTATRYFALLGLTAIIKVADVITNEIASPILGFSIYNPDKKVITEFTKNQLQILANTMWMLNGIKSIYMTMLTISQIDIAFINMFMGEFASFFTIRMLLNEKKFATEEEQVNELHELVGNNLV